MSGHRRRLSAVIVLAAVLGVGAVAWSFASSPPSSPPAYDAAAPRPTRGSAPGGPKELGVPSAATREPVPSTVPSQPIVAVHVQSDDGRSLPGCKIHIHPPIANDDATAVAEWAPPVRPVIVARGKTGDDGRCRIAVDATFIGHVLAVVGRTDGWQRGGTVQDIHAGTNHVVIRLARGRSISGHVVTPTGRGVGGVRVLATSDPSLRPNGIMTPDQREAADFVDHAFGDSAYAASAISSEDGGFEIAGLANGEYFVTVVDDAWLAAPRPVVPVGSHEIVLEVTRAFELLVTARTTSGKRLECFSVVARFAREQDDEGDALPYVLGGSSGRCRVRLAPPTRVADARFLRVQVQARGCHAAHATVDLSRPPPIELDLELREKDGAIVELRLVGASGRIEDDLEVSFVGPRETEGTPVDVRLENGIPVATYRPGSWLIRVRSASTFPLAPAFEQDVVLRSDTTTVVRGRIEQGATLTVDLRAIDGHDRIDRLGFSSPLGTLSIRRPESGEPGLVIWRDVPPAEWRVTAKRPDGTFAHATVEVERAGNAWVTLR